MKKIIVIILLIIFSVACNSIASTSVTTITPSEMTAATISYISPTSTVTQTEATATLESEISPTSDGSVRLAYNPADWTLLLEYDDAPAGITTDSQGRMWAIVRDKVSYFDGQNWISVSQSGLNLSNLSQTHIAHDGTVWVLGEKAQNTLLAHYGGKHWTIFPLPISISPDNVVSLAVDASDRIWIGLSVCSTNQCLYRFDGATWQEYPLPVRNHDNGLGGVSVISDTKGNIWVCGGWQDGIARFLGTGWQIYTGKDLWPDRPSNLGERAPAEHIIIVAGVDGSIWAYLDSTPIIVRIDETGKIEGFPIRLGIDLTNVFYLVMYDSKGNVLWAGTDGNANLSGITPTTLGYFNGTHWFTFTNLPFKNILEINEEPNGIMLISTENGLFSYQPH